MVELANVSLKACALKGFPGLAALTLAHRPFALGINHVYGPNETVEAYAFPAPRTGPCTGAAPPTSTSTSWTRPPWRPAPSTSAAWRTSTSGPSWPANLARWDHRCWSMGRYVTRRATSGSRR